MPDPTPPVAPVAPDVPVVDTPPPVSLQIDLEPDEGAPAPDAEPPVPPPAPVVPAVAAAPVAPAPEPPKMVPLSAVQEERGKRQNAEALWNRAQPIIEALNANPDLVAQLTARANGQPAPIAPAQDTAELEAIADRFVLYLPDGSGKPDLGRAAQVRDMLRSETKRAVDDAMREHVTPLRQTVVSQQAATARTRIEAAAKDRGVSMEHLGPLLNEAMATNPEALSDPKQGAALIIAARGLQAMMGGGAGSTAPAPALAPAAQPPVIPAAPLVTEAPGHRTAPAEVPAMMSRIAKRHGWKPEKISKSFGRLDEAPARHIPVEKED